MFWCLLGLADGDPATPCDYFEYSSTISASLMSAGRSPRSGTALNTPLNLFESTSTPDGDRSIVEDTVSASFTRSCFLARSDNARTEDRRVGKECVRQSRIRWSPDNLK